CGAFDRIVFAAHFVEFAPEEGEVVAGGGFGSGRVDEAADGIEAHGAVGCGDAGTEGDRRDVSLAGGAQAEDEAEFSRSEAGLVGRGDDARVEERAGFERI
ncbi:MAG: hypothetical protein ACK56I_36540, partial [bacterium]